MTADATATSPHSEATALLERTGELRRLSELVDAAAAGHGGAAAVIGPAGIGKTSLLEAAATMAAERHMTCLRARGGELEQELVYGIVAQLFEPALRGLPAGERAAVLEGAARTAAPALGLGGELRPVATDSAFAVLHGLYWTTANLAQRGPLLLAVDDLHWADAASLRFLAYLARRVEELPVLVLTAARPPTDPDHAQLLEAIVADTSVLEISPPPLSETATARLVTAALGATPEPAFAKACHEATGGNPFLCSTLAAAFVDEGIEPRASFAARIPEIAARALSTGVVRRLGRLPPHAHALARSVAVLGTEVETRQAWTLAGLTPEEAAGAADALADLGIFRPGSPLEFAHPLVRLAVHDDIGAAERALMHRRAGRLLRDQGAPAERVAIHVLACEPQGEAWIVETLRRAAADAAGKGDAGAAAAYLQRALREPPAPDERAALLRELGTVELVLGRSVSASKHLEAARSLTTDARERVEIALELGSALGVSGGFDEAVEVLDEALSELDAVDDDLRLSLEGLRLSWTCLAPDGLARVPADGVRPGPALGATRGARAYLAACATVALLRLEDPARIRAWAAQSIEAGVSHDVALQGVNWHNMCYPLTFAGGFELARRMVDDALTEIARSGSPLAAARWRQSRAMLHLLEGDLREAAEDARLAVAAGRQVGITSWLIALAVLIDSLVGLGEIEQADEALTENAMEGEIRVHFLNNWVLHARGWLRLAQDRLEEAIDDFEELGRRGERWHPWNPAMYLYRSGLALALLRAGRAAEARRHAHEELELSRRARVPRAIGVSLRTCGLVEGGEEGLELLRESVEVLATSGARLEQARSLVELGAALRRAGERAKAREPLHAGMELAHACGAEPLVARAREELVATGARPRRILRTGIDALTPSELRVARMAAGGMTNRAIAQALFVTLRTVEVHLSHAYQKLGISSREGLAGRLAADRG